MSPTAMRFPDSFLDEIRARLPVSEVVKQRVALKKAGREWRGLSPFNKEKTPSFFVNDQKGFYHDFSSGKSGDQFKFLMDTEGLSFPEAVERLAQLAGLALPAINKAVEREEQRRKSLYEVLELATNFFEDSLASREGEEARAYLLKRGITSETQTEFRIGYAPGGRLALKEHLSKLGVPISDMIETGLLIAGDDISVPYDRFRNRVIIPIHDHRGRIIAFGGRTLSDDVQPKYLNSPETNLFRKGEIVFNFHRARAPAHEQSHLIAVEGYLDAISVYQAGLKCVVALMGTAFTEDQVQTLWRLSPEPVICLDGDKAGRAAADRSLDRILPALRTGFSFKFAFLPSGADPDDMIRKSGLTKFNLVLRDAMPLWDMLWEREFRKVEILTPDHKAMFEKSILDLVSTIGDKRVQASYKFRARAQLVALFQSLDWKASISKNKKKERSFLKSELLLEPVDPLLGIQKTLIGILIEYPELMELHVERMMLANFSERIETFKREVHRIFDEFKDRLVVTFYEQIHPDFAEMLADIHGRVDKVTGEPIADGLYRRFPLLQWGPPEDFVNRCVDLFFELLEVKQAEKDLKELYSDPVGIEVLSELERVTHLARDILEKKSKVAERDKELADEAREIWRQLKQRESALLPGLDRAMMALVG